MTARGRVGRMRGLGRLPFEKLGAIFLQNLFFETDLLHYLGCLNSSYRLNWSL